MGRPAPAAKKAALDVTLEVFFSEDHQALASVAAGRVRRLEALLSALDPSAQELVVSSLEGLSRALKKVSFEGAPVPLKAVAERKPGYDPRHRR